KDIDDVAIRTARQLIVVGLLANLADFRHGTLRSPNSDDVSKGSPPSKSPPENGSRVVSVDVFRLSDKTVAVAYFPALAQPSQPFSWICAARRQLPTACSTGPSHSSLLMRPERPRPCLANASSCCAEH